MALVAIVGAGPAGLGAAISAVGSGCEVMLIDEAIQVGGQIYRQPAEGLPLPKIGTEQEIVRKGALLEGFETIRDRVDYRPLTTAHSLYAGPELQIANDTASERLRPDAVILATGVSERCVPFDGWTLPGVMYAGAVQSLLKSNGIFAGQAIAICGVGPLPLAVGAQLAKCGAHIVVVALLHPLRRMAYDPIGLFSGREIVGEGLQFRRWLREKNVPVLEGWAPVAIEGRHRAEAIVLAPVDEKGHRITGRSRRFLVDTVALNFGFTANSELARMAGAATRFDPIGGGWLPVTDRRGLTSLENIYAAGDGAGLRGALVAEAEGRIVGAAAAAAALRSTPKMDVRRERERARNERFQLALRRLLELPPGVWDWAQPDTVVCRCEGVTHRHLMAAFAEGHRTLDGIKRKTRAGMGWCGGRTCLQAVAAYAGASVGEEIAPMRARPVARPVKLGALGNVKRAPDA